MLNFRDTHNGGFKVHDRGGAIRAIVFRGESGLAYHTGVRAFGPALYEIWPSSKYTQEVLIHFLTHFRQSYMLAVVPAVVEDVVATVKVAREYGIPFAARSGHHCVTTSMRHLENGMLIDMRRFKSMALNREGSGEDVAKIEFSVTVGGGTITDDFVRFLHDNKLEVSEFLHLLYNINIMTKCDSIIAKADIGQLLGHVRPLESSAWPLEPGWGDFRANMATWYALPLNIWTSWTNELNSIA